MEKEIFNFGLVWFIKKVLYYYGLKDGKNGSVIKCKVVRC